VGQFQRAIVIGASSGIGREIARQLAESGATVVAIARREDRLASLAQEFGQRILPFAHDVTDYDAVPAAFQEATRRLGGLDLVVYASGVMPTVGAHEYDFAKDREMIEVNLLGAMAWLNQAAIRFEGTKSGTILAIGSVAGDRGRAGQPGYNTSKAALATYLEALRNRLAKSGITVVTIKPGPTATEMTAHLAMKGMMQPADVARIALAKAGRSGEHYVKLTHRVIFAVIRLIPSGIFRKLPL
jgi:NADP-dependent 3-hydroxy acid dehydrogenase YdfG